MPLRQGERRRVEVCFQSINAETVRKCVREVSGGVRYRRDVSWSVCGDGARYDEALGRMRSSCGFLVALAANELARALDLDPCMWYSLGKCIHLYIIKVSRIWGCRKYDK